MLLDQNAQSTLLARLTEGGGNDQPDPPRSSLETASATPNQMQSRETNSQSESKQAEQPQMIPYDRFRKVNETKKEYQRRYEEQQQELERLRKELDSKGSTKSNEDWLEDLLAVPEDPQESKLKDLESRLQNWELKEAEKELTSIVNQQIKKHSDLDRELVESVVYQTIAENPQADLDEAVGRLREFIGYIQSKGNPPTPQKPSAPPRPSATGQRNYAPTTEKPKNLATAREALYNYLTKR